MPRRPLTCLLAALVPLTALSVRAEAHSPAWTGDSSKIAGTSRYDRGEWIHTDFVYDDYGANTTPAGQPNIVSLAPTDGDFRYPNGSSFAGNAADIVEVRARAIGNDLEVRVLLQTLVDPSVVALWVEAGATASVFTSANSVIDAGANTVTFTLPGAAAQDSVVLNVGAGLHDGQGGLRAGTTGTAHANPGAFTTGGPTTARLFDLAFNTRALEGRGGAWNETVQSAALQAGALDQFRQTIDVTALRAGTSTAEPTPSGYSVRLFESRQALGEGVASSFPQYRGRWQPYAVWIPEDYDGEAETPLFLNLHSLSVHHNQYRGGSAPSATYRSMYEQFEAEVGAIIATPLARGPDGWYWNEALVDTLEVWADVLAHYAVDADRVYVGGYSMGGYGTYRLATLMPDAFASAVSIVGPPANGIWAYPAPPTGGEANANNTRPQLESMRHVPIWVTHGAFDELVPVTGVVHQVNRIRDLGHEYRFALHPAADHFSFAVQDGWSREAAWLAAHPTRVEEPHRVTLKIRPASWASGGTAPAIRSLLAALTGEIGARLDGAYWVGGVDVAPGADVTATVDLTSGGIGEREAGVSPVATAGVDGPSPHLLTGQDRVIGSGPASDAIAGRLQNVRSITIDVGRAGVSDAPDVSGITVTGGPVHLTFVRDGIAVGSVQLG